MRQCRIDELTHHGIKGQRWGFRRFQNKDGSLTPAGRKRVAKMKDEYTALTGKRLIRKPTQKNTDTGPKEESVAKKKSISKMTDAELKEHINRLQMEKQAMSLQNETASTGSKIAKSIAKDVVGEAAMEAGKSLLKDLMLKIGKEQLGLDPKETKDALEELKKEAKISKLKRQIEDDKDWFENRKTEEANKEQSSKDSKKEKTKTKEDDEPIYGTNKKDWSFNKSTTDKTDPWSKFDRSKTYDAVYEEMSRGEGVVDKYRQLRLPAPKD